MLQSAAPSAASTQENKYSNFVMTIQYGGQGQPKLEDLQDGLDRFKAKAQYWIIGYEQAPSTGQLHLQCYFQFKSRERRSALVRIIPCYMEAANGTPEENKTYCSKGENFIEGGEMRGTSTALAAGRKRGGDANAERWKEALEIIESGNLDELDPQILICHWGAVNAIRRKRQAKPAELSWTGGDTPNLWLYGKSGCGKSRRARELAPEAYLKMCNKWWDNYEGEADVIIDDFDKEHACLCHHLKIWADRYACPSEFKGGAGLLRPKRIIVTSNWSPSEIWSTEKDLEPILRRFKVINMSPLDGAFQAATGSGSATSPAMIFQTPSSSSGQGSQDPGNQQPSFTQAATQTIDLSQEEDEEDELTPSQRDI